MKYSDFPQEIKDKVKQRVEEQGNCYTQKTEVLLDGNHASGKSNGAFSWIETPEGNAFWCEVMKGDLETFYKNYPKDNQSVSEEGFKELPKNVKKGDRFVYCSHIRLDGSERSSKLNLGTVVVLDSSTLDDKQAYFLVSEKGRMILDWGYLKPYKEETISDSLSIYSDPCFNSNFDYFEIGDEVEVIYKKPGTWQSLKIGTRFVIEDFGQYPSQTADSFNSDKQTAHFNNNVFGVNWTKNMLKIVRKGNQFNLNNKFNIHHGESSSTTSNVCRPIEPDIRSGQIISGQIFSKIDIPQIRSGY